MNAVPHLRPCSSVGICTAMPKSMTNASVCSSFTRVFSSDMSAWQIPLEWMYCSTTRCREVQKAARPVQKAMETGEVSSGRGKSYEGIFVKETKRGRRKERLASRSKPTVDKKAGDAHQTLRKTVTQKRPDCTRPAQRHQLNRINHNQAYAKKKTTAVRTNKQRHRRSRQRRWRGSIRHHTERTKHAIYGIKLLGV